MQSIGWKFEKLVKIKKLSSDICFHRPDETFIVAYVNSADFEFFWKRYSAHVQEYDFPLQIRRPFNVLPYPNAAARVATLILTRDGFDFPVYFIAFKIS